MCIIKIYKFIAWCYVNDPLTFDNLHWPKSNLGHFAFYSKYVLAPHYLDDVQWVDWLYF